MIRSADCQRYCRSVSSSRKSPDPRLPGADAASLPRFGELLNRTYQQFTQFTTVALEHLGITNIGWVALLCFDEQPTLSQSEIAQVLGMPGSETT